MQPEFFWFIYCKFDFLKKTMETLAKFLHHKMGAGKKKNLNS
jgi:hypothetical protein